MSDRQRYCVMCSTPYRDVCQHCPSHRRALEIQANTIRELRLELLGHQELQLKHFRLKNQHQRLRQEHQRLRQELYKLKDVYKNQIGLIYMLKKNAIENIGKRLISFLFKQT